MQVPSSGILRPPISDHGSYRCILYIYMVVSVCVYVYIYIYSTLKRVSKQEDQRRHWKIGTPCSTLRSLCRHGPAEKMPLRPQTWVGQLHTLAPKPRSGLEINGGKQHCSHIQSPKPSFSSTIVTDAAVGSTKLNSFRALNGEVANSGGSLR